MGYAIVGLVVVCVLCVVVSIALLIWNKDSEKTSTPDASDPPLAQSDVSQCATEGNAKFDGVSFGWRASAQDSPITVSLVEGDTPIAQAFTSETENCVWDRTVPVSSVVQVVLPHAVQWLNDRVVSARARLEEIGGGGAAKELRPMVYLGTENGSVTLFSSEAVPRDLGVGDIRIYQAAACVGDGIGGTLAYVYVIPEEEQSGHPVYRNVAGDVTLDGADMASKSEAEAWWVLVHEMCHSIGMPHAEPRDAAPSIMDPHLPLLQGRTMEELMGDAGLQSSTEDLLVWHACRAHLRSLTRTSA